MSFINFIATLLIVTNYSASSMRVQSSKWKIRHRVAVIWDVDGTLCNSHELGVTSTQAVLEKNGYPLISIADYHTGTRLTTPRRLAWHATGDPDNAIGFDLGKQFDDLYVGLVSPTTAPLYEGIAPLVQSVADNEYAVQGALSNACGDYVKAALRENHVSHCFAIQLGADEVPSAKPSPLGLLQCCKTLNTNPSTSVYIGDSPSDAEAARAAGMLSIGVTWGSHSVESVTSAFDKVVHTVEDLRKEVDNFIQTFVNSLQNEANSSQEVDQIHKGVSWSEDVIDNEGMNKKKTDDEFW